MRIWACSGATFAVFAVFAACSSFGTDATTSDAGTDQSAPPPDDGSTPVDAPTDDTSDSAPVNPFCPAAGCTVTPVITTAYSSTNCFVPAGEPCDHVHALAVDGTHLYWSLTNTTDGHSILQSCAKSGCGASPPINGVDGYGFTGIDGIAVTSDDVFWTQSDPSDISYGVFGLTLPIATCVNPTSGTAPPCRLAQSFVNPVSITGGHSTVAFFTAVTNGVQHCTVGADCESVVGSFPFPIVAIASGVTAAFWASANAIVACKPDFTGCSETAFAPNGIVHGLATDDKYLYWTATDLKGGGFVYGCTLSNCDDTNVLTSAIGSPEGIAVDGADLYVASSMIVDGVSSFVINRITR